MKKLLFALVLVTFYASAQEYPTGMIWDEESYRSIPYKVQFTASTYDNLPTSYSLEKWVPIPGNQGQYGTCVAFAAAYGLRTTMYAKDYNITDKQQITQAALSPSFVYEAIRREEDVACNMGANPKLGMEALKVLGVPTMETVPYKCNPVISTDAQLEAIDYRIRDYQTLFFYDEQAPMVRVNATKKALSEGYPVLIGMKLPESFFAAKKVWRSKPTDKGTLAKKHGHHAMVAVGYDDNFEGGAFRVLNSWGTAWGDNGYIWVPYKEYDEWTLGALQPYSYYKKKDEVKPDVIPDDKPDVKPEPDPEPIAKKLPEGNLRFELNTNEDMQVTRISTRNLVVEDDVEGEDLVAYRTTSSYPSGTRFRFYLENKHEGYIYAFATDLTQKINKILPYDDGMSPIISENSTIAFPSEKKVIRMDNNPGTDYLLILFSQQKLDEKAIQNKMQNTPGGLTSKIKAALGSKLIDKSMIQYAAGEAGFKVKEGAEGYVVPLMVEISHK
ncbi:C1 family peptidase [Jejudonia soesokkakensis]|uniref:C1 family peptidase n=1 Tax=Jejudonia soesokkakensis TaxID=1323432 RepID=A0ABW2MRK7_9FLAO